MIDHLALLCTGNLAEGWRIILNIIEPGQLAAMDGVLHDILQWDYISQSLLPHVSFLLFHYIPYSETSELENLENFNIQYRDTGATILLPSGSFTEGLRLPPIILRSQNGKLKGMGAGDIDIMVIDMRKKVGERGQCQDQPQTDYFIHTEGMHPGYTLIEIASPENTSERFKTKFCSSEKTFLDAAKVTSKFHGLKETSRHNISFQGPAVTFTTDNETIIPSVTDIDNVHALFVTSWPQIANEWIIRKRASDWPSQETIEDIVGKGCHVVAKGHPASKTITSEWRFSFSYAEGILSRQLSRCQKQCYLLLKVLHKHAFKDPKGIVSYHLKTILYWAAEEIPHDLWTEDSLCQMLFYLLDKLLYCLIQHNIPSYFIPSNNLIDAVPEEVIKVIKQRVSQVRSDPMRYLLSFNKEYKFSHGPMFIDLKDIFRKVLDHGKKAQNVCCTLDEIIVKLFMPTASDLIRQHLNDFQKLHERFEIENDPEDEIRPVNNAIIIALDLCRLVEKTDIVGAHPVLVFLPHLPDITDDVALVKLCTRLLERFPDAPDKESLQQLLGEKSAAVEFRRFCNLYNI